LEVTGLEVGEESGEEGDMGVEFDLAGAVDDEVVVFE